MMISGIDVGGTNTQGVLMDGSKLKSFVSIPGNKPSHVVRCYRFLKKNAGKKGVKVVTTGGGARSIKRSDFPESFTFVNEIKAIGMGGVYLSGKRSVFVVSIGTGTAFVSVKNGKAKHVGGTGVGGGTLHGLSNLLLKMSLEDVEKIGKTKKNLDLTVRDIVGRGIGKVPASATASNFGKAKSGGTKSAIASSLLNMVAESIGVMAYFAAKSVGQEKSILVCGRVAMNGVVKNRITETVKMLGGHAKIPKNAEYCAAIGAASGV
jgi:type II pantothenate kinase